MLELYLAEDSLPRCKWCSQVPEFLAYHDEEWGFPVADDRRLFEKVCLESFQSGLSWRTILLKRENFRQAFCNFDYQQVAKFTEQDVERLLQNAGIIRHRGKIEATINNAKQVQAIIDEFGSLASYFWQYEVRPDSAMSSQTQSTSIESIALSKDLKKRGWKFVGATTMYALMQAMGLVNDHVEECHSREKVAEARRVFAKP
uniref:DNA-3-methyladenine glycosylase I n=1 Tax=uncultured Acinetobacter sp. TaxID=165433 RepID=UPI00262B8534|nr:DNA-3-methyladenine glycosylase I [uncultured Acinetobacter sp.]